MTYSSFLDSKRQYSETDDGFDPIWMPDELFDFQQHLTEWAIRQGRSAIFADCGLGKTFMQLVWAENVVRHTNGHVLILTPLSVAPQTVREAEKFGIDCSYSRDGAMNSRIVVTNYERLHHFTSDAFDGIVCDESSIIKSFQGSTKKQITEFMRTRPYRLLCTATASPNDYVELGTSSEALGYLGYQDMITKFFKEDTIKDYLGWGRKKYRLRHHAIDAFWKWVSSWARTMRQPSDYGFDNDGFELPPLDVSEHEVGSVTRDGMLFPVPAFDLREQRQELRDTLEVRCDKVASIVNNQDTSVMWCYLNDEADRLVEVVDGAVQVSGSDSDDTKESKLLDFVNGGICKLVTKPKISGFGMNWQHCNHTTLFPSHSFEQYYQCVRRFWRFGQVNPVQVDIITTEGQKKVLNSIREKSKRCDEMFTQLVRNMLDAQSISQKPFTKESEVPTWL